MKVTKKAVTAFLCLMAAVILTIYSSARLRRNSSRYGSGQNVILIVLDTVRADHLGVYGYARPTSPNLDAFAARSIIFEKAYSQASWTLPSMASYLTSLYQEVHKINASPATRSFNVLSPKFVTFAESLKNNGFKTAAISAHPWFNDKLGVTSGFDEVDRININLADSYEAQPLTDYLIKWLDENNQSRFFLYAHFMGAHSPYITPPWIRGRFTGAMKITENIRHIHQLFEKLGSGKAYKAVQKLAGEGKVNEEELAYLMAEYDEKISYTDENVGRLLDFIEELKLDDNTIIIITADHGEAFFEHNNVYHKTAPYNELLHVPMILYAPGLDYPGMRVKEIVELIDIYPTVHEILGLEMSVPVNGMSLIPLLKGEKSDGAALAQGASYKVITEDWSAFIDSAELEVKEIYNLLSDPFEQKNLLGQNPPEAGMMRDICLNFRNSIKALSRYYRPETEKTKLDRETIEKLKSLGYLN